MLCLDRTSHGGGAARARCLGGPLRGIEKVNGRFLLTVPFPLHHPEDVVGPSHGGDSSCERMHGRYCLPHTL